MISAYDWIQLMHSGILGDITFQYNISTECSCFVNLNLLHLHVEYKECECTKGNSNVYWTAKPD